MSAFYFKKYIKIKNTLNLESYLAPINFKKNATCSYYQLFNGWSFMDITSISSMLADDLDNKAIISQVIFS